MTRKAKDPLLILVDAVAEIRRKRENNLCRDCAAPLPPHRKRYCDECIDRICDEDADLLR